jgi:hypothetical protein
VANNSGGAIPKSDASNGGARIDPKTHKRLPAGTNTDVLQGTMSVSGGYTQPGGGSGLDFNNASAFRRAARNGGSTNPGSQVVGLDLKQFLPGGSRDPYRGIAGMASRNEINGKGEDIFRLISNKITEKCRLGILWSCE